MTKLLYPVTAALSAVGSLSLFGATPQWARAIAAAALLAAAACASILLFGQFIRIEQKAVELRDTPPGVATFRGRRRELRELHDRFNRLRGKGSAHGAVIIAIHGMPGVGKSALAQAFARDLAGEFPGGLLYANLGSAGRIRAEADVLNRFLRALRPGEDIQGSTVERAARFRSLTADAQILVMLDAARDHEQVAPLLPTGKRCGVIVTSRRDLGPALGVHSFLLGVPDMDGALEILHAVSHTPPDADQKFAMEIVDRLGRLPMAIRAVADSVVETSGSLAPAARQLRKPAPLESLGQFVQDRVESEYDRLTSEERRALRMASLFETPSFEPRMLAPLLGLDAIEVEKIVSRIAGRQLLERAGLDEVTGMDRYRFHPVFRFFAESQRKADRDETEAPLRRVNELYLQTIDLILAETDPSYRQSQPQRLAQTPEELPMQPRSDEKLPNRWVRAEYRNLLRSVTAAHEKGLDAMCWRIAAQLGDCVPDDMARELILNGLDLGYDAAKRLRDQRAMAAVLLARGGFLGRLGGYWVMERKPPVFKAGHVEAFDALADAASLANRVRSGSSPINGIPKQRVGEEPFDDGKLKTLESEAYRRLAETHLRNGAYRDAARELDRALQLAYLGDDKAIQVPVVQLMRIAALDRYSPAQLPPMDIVNDEMAYWHGWASAELARRDRRWKEASKTLHLLHDRFADDASRVATILLRLAELRLEQLRVEPDLEPQRSRVRAAHRAAEALYRFQHMHDHVGATRARCVFARGLLTQGKVDEADEQRGYALASAAELEPLIFHDLSPLQAMLWQAEGEVRWHQGREDDGKILLLKAARLFRLHGDRVNEASALAAAGLASFPPGSFDAGPPGRRPVTHIKSTQETLYSGESFDVCYTLEPPSVTEELPPAGGRYLDVVLVAEQADVNPTVHTARLDPWARLEPLWFKVTPHHDGPLRMQVLVYSATDGSLLQKSDLESQEIADAADRSAA